MSNSWHYGWPRQKFSTERSAEAQLSNTASFIIIDRRQFITNGTSHRTNKDQGKVPVAFRREKVNLKKKKTKGSITKEVIRVGLMNYFEQDAGRADGAMQAILAAAPTKEVASVSVSGLKG